MFTHSYQAGERNYERKYGFDWRDGIVNIVNSNHIGSMNNLYFHKNKKLCIINIAFNVICLTVR